MVSESDLASANEPQSGKDGAQKSCEALSLHNVLYIVSLGHIHIRGKEEVKAKKINEKAKKTKKK